MDFVAFDLSVLVVVVNEGIHSAIGFEVDQQGGIFVVLHANDSGHTALSVVGDAHAHHTHVIVGYFLLLHGGFVLMHFLYLVHFLGLSSLCFGGFFRRSGLGSCLCLFLLRCLVGFFVTFYKGFVGFLSCHGCAHAGCHTGSCKGGTGGIARRFLFFHFRLRRSGRS